MEALGLPRRDRGTPDALVNYWALLAWLLGWLGHAIAGVADAATHVSEPGWLRAVYAVSCVILGIIATRLLYLTLRPVRAQDDLQTIWGAFSLGFLIASTAFGGIGCWYALTGATPQASTFVIVNLGMCWVGWYAVRVTRKRTEAAVTCFKVLREGAVG